MIDRVIVGLTMKISGEREGWILDIDRRLVESSLGGGRVVTEHDRYDRLTYAELGDLVETVLDGSMPGARSIAPGGEQLALVV